MSAPCRNCKDRHPACHDKCKTYIEWVTLEHKKKEDVMKHTLSEVDTIHINNIYRERRRHNRV